MDTKGIPIRVKGSSPLDNVMIDFSRAWGNASSVVVSRTIEVD